MSLELATVPRVGRSGRNPVVLGGHCIRAGGFRANGSIRSPELRSDWARGVPSWKVKKNPGFEMNSGVERGVTGVRAWGSRGVRVLKPSR